jgi:Transglycosylase SLT domain
MSGRFGRRMRKGVMGTAVAAAAMAALSASQAPGLANQPPKDHGHAAPPPGPAISGDSPYYTDLPPLNTAPGTPGTSPTDTPGGGSTLTPGGAALPRTVLDAYMKAQASIDRSDAECHLPWELLAAIGQVESGQARGGDVRPDGTTVNPILGPELNGNGFANISDTDHGRYDGDSVHDRAVGPMQFIPSTWATWGVDGNGDGRADPNNVYDAALAAGHYLCADGRNLADSTDMDSAILGYNHSEVYLHTVRSWYEYFHSGHHDAVPDRPGHPTTPPTSSATPTSPSPSSTPHPGHSHPGSGSGSGSASGKPTPTVSATGTVSPAPTSSSPKPSPSGSSTPLPTCPSTSPSPSASASGSASATPTPTATGSASPSPSPSPSGSDKPCATPSPSSSGSAVAPSPGVTPPATP